MPRSYVEDKVQADIVAWIRLVSPDCIVAAIPNGAYHDARQGARLKWTGMLSGMPDLVVLAPRSKALFVEVKAPKGVLSSQQKEVHEALRLLGHTVILARGIDDVREAFRQTGVATREVA